MPEDAGYFQSQQGNQERLRLFVESLNGFAILLLDPEGRIESANVGAERLYGYSGEEIIGLHFSRIYSPEDVDAQIPQRELAQAVAEDLVEDEGWRLRKDGSRFWADLVITSLRDPATGQLQGFGTITRDLTKRKTAKKNLHAVEAEFRLLVERVEEYAIFMLDPTGHITTWNSGAEKIKGYSRSEIIGKSFECFYTPEERAEGKPARLLEMAKRDGHVRDQGPRVRKDGSIFQADVLITAVRDDSGALRGFAKVSRDVTDQIRMRGMEAAKLAAEETSKAKDAFLAVLSHELRTPLTPVLAAASYLVENASRLPEDLREVVGAIQRNTRLEAQLIDDLLDLTRIGRGKVELRLEAVDLHAALDDAVKICERELVSKDLKLTTDCAAPEHWIWADSTRIRQVFWNLLNNAVKFTPAAGQITIRSLNPSEGAVVVEICDTGIGIDPAQIGRIFNAFEQGERTVTRRFGGLGLGLAITRSLVEMQGGTIVARSEGQNTGATFRVSFAVAPSQQVSDASRPQKSTMPAAKKLRILLVDDHDDTRRLLSKLLLQRGYNVSTASTMRDALNVLEEQHDVLISDIGLPDGSGLDLMREAQRRRPIRGIALSGFGMAEDIERSVNAGFEHHLTKPLDMQNLQSILEAMIRQ